MHSTKLISGFIPQFIILFRSKLTTTSRSINLPWITSSPIPPVLFTANQPSLPQTSRASSKLCQQSFTLKCSRYNLKIFCLLPVFICFSLHPQDEGSGKELSPESDLYYFSEEKYIKEKPEEFDEKRKALLRAMPTADNIYEFTKALYDCAQFRYSL